MKITFMLAGLLLMGTVSGGVVTQTDTSWWTLENGVLTLSNANADLASSTNVYETVIGADVTKIVKTGPGAVRLDGNNANFAGEIEVQAGLLMGWVKEKYNGSNYTPDNYGAPTKVTVTDGATFEMLATPIENVAYDTGRFANTQFYVSGSGVKGMGALYRRGSLQSAERSYATIKHLTLTGDTMLYVGMRWGYDSNNCTLVQNGHTLKFMGTNKIFNFARNGTLTVTDPGELIVDNTQLHYLEGAKPIVFDGTRAAADQTVVITNFGYLVMLAPDNKGPGDWICPYQIKSYGGYLRGPSGADNTTRFSTFSGDVLLLQGTLNLDNYASKGSCGIMLSGHVNGVGTLSTANGSSNNTTTYLCGGGSASNVFGNLTVSVGRVVLTGGARYDITNSTAIGGSSLAETYLARLVITNATAYMPPCNCDKTIGLVNVGIGDSVYGVVEIGKNAVVTNDFKVGTTGNGGGAIWLRDNAKLFWHGGGGSNPFLGSAGYAFLGIRDNALIECQGWHNIGTSNGRAFVLQRGGTYRNAKCGGGHDGHGANLQCNSISATAFKIGRTRGAAHYYNGGGTLQVDGSVWFTWDYPYGVYKSEGAFTVDGAAASSEINDVCFCGTFAGTPSYLPNEQGTFGFVNVNRGGTLTVNRMYKTVQEGKTWKDHAGTWNWASSKNLITNTWAYLNFDGGILKVKGTGDFFSANGTAEDPRMPTRVTVYAGGATIDTNGKDSTWRLPLEKPYGKGVKAITLPAAARTATDYIGPGRVLFENMTGSNVTALVDFDETIRSNLGVIVTCPGFGFTTVPTVKIETAACKNAYHTGATVEMVDFDDAAYVHGGLTKRGGGTLTLTRANTYGGATRCAGGTLAFTDAAGIPAGSVIEFPAAALAGGEKDVPLLTAPSCAGHGLRVTDVDDLDDKTFGRLRTMAHFTTPLAAVPAVAFVDSQGQTVSRALWHVVLTQDGRTLKFGPNRGMVLILR